MYSPDSFSQHYEEMDKEKSGAFGNVFKVCLHLLVYMYIIYT